LWTVTNILLVAVIVIGFTRFRLVIEAMGQEQADRILTEIGRRLAECLRDSPNCFNTMENGLRTAAIASLDSFRFGLMMTQSKDDEMLTTLHQRLLDALSQPIQIQKRKLEHQFSGRSRRMIHSCVEEFHAYTYSS